GWYVERRAGGGAYGLQAALDPDEPAALRRHRHQGRSQGRHRALRRGRDSRCGGDRRGGGGLRHRGRLPREVRRRLARRDPPQPGRLPRARAELLGVPQVILTGFMATGKTEVGRRLARRLGRPFVDIDGLVEAASGKKVADIFASEGEARFRQLERAAVAEACLVPEAVVATGGGTLLDAENRRRLAAAGPIVCLAASPEEILRRVGDPRPRPLLADGSTGGDRLARIRQLLAERAPLRARDARGRHVGPQRGPGGGARAGARGGTVRWWWRAGRRRG